MYEDRLFSVMLLQTLISSSKLSQRGDLLVRSSCTSPISMMPKTFPALSSLFPVLRPSNSWPVRTTVLAFSHTINKSGRSAANEIAIMPRPVSHKERTMKGTSLAKNEAPGEPPAAYAILTTETMLPSAHRPSRRHADSLALFGI